MLLAYPREFPPDATEARLPDAAAARAFLGLRGAAIDDVLARRRAQLAPLLRDASDRRLLASVEAAVVLGFARLGLRHGHFGTDFHAYHNEGHVLDICGARLDRLLASAGVNALPLAAWCVLLLFGACHDLRQREAPQPGAAVGANERASAEEAERILVACNVPREAGNALVASLELAIAGSTFDARVPAGSRLNAAELVQSGGALAPRLEPIIARDGPDARDRADLAYAMPVALVAADLDTANVADAFAGFVASGEALCREREMLSGRTLDSPAGAMPVLAFLTTMQERYFFELHRFVSPLGNAAFAAGKAANAARLKAVTASVRARIAVAGAPPDGDHVIGAWRAAAAELGA